MAAGGNASSGPWDYLLGGAGLALAAGALAAVDYVLAAFVTGLAAVVALLIGSVAQGIRVGRQAERRDQQRAHQHDAA